MILLTVFISSVFLYSLVSVRLERTVFTPPMVFTSVGVLVILVSPELAELEVNRKAFLWLAEIGLVMTLFTDATHVNLRSLRTGSNLPLRLLSTGMLLTIALGMVFALILFPEISIWEAGILAAILAPTDAGLGQVIVNSPLVPARIRQSLNVEAGLNDGLSVPFMMLFIALAVRGTGDAGRIMATFILEQLGLGALLGLGLGLVGGWLLGKAQGKGWIAGSFQQLGLVALPLLSVMTSDQIGASMLIAAFVAGLAVQAGFKDARKIGVEFTEEWGHLFNFFVFFLFGLLVAKAWDQFSLTLALYAVLSLTVVRILPVAIALIGTGLSKATVWFMGWFGPRGLASIVLGLVYLEEEAKLPGEETIRLAVMVTVLLSIFAHGLSSLPGIGLYARKVVALADDAPENDRVLIR
jgi:sodium/hydrogen antiporter